MDPITVTQLVQDRTDDLLRTADQIRQERALRSKPAAEAVARPTRPAKVRPSPTKAGGCAPAEHAL